MACIPLRAHFVVLPLLARQPLLGSLAAEKQLRHNFISFESWGL